MNPLADLIAARLRLEEALRDLPPEVRETVDLFLAEASLLVSDANDQAGRCRLEEECRVPWYPVLWERSVC